MKYLSLKGKREVVSGFSLPLCENRSEMTDWLHCIRPYNWSHKTLCAQLSLTLSSFLAAEQGWGEGAINVCIHVHRAWKILCCSIINLHQCPAITLLTSLSTCRGQAAEPANTWATAGKPGLFFFLNTFYITEQPNLPSMALRPYQFHWLKTFSFTDFKPGRKEKGGGGNSIFLPGPWLLLWVGPRFVPTTPCMTQMPSGPFLYGMYTVCVWVEALPDIKGRTWRENAFTVSISWVVITQYPSGDRIIVHFKVYELKQATGFSSFLIRSCPSRGFLPPFCRDFALYSFSFFRNSI